MQILE